MRVNYGRHSPRSHFRNHPVLSLIDTTAAGLPILVASRGSVRPSLMRSDAPWSELEDVRRAPSPCPRPIYPIYGVVSRCSVPSLMHSSVR